MRVDYDAVVAGYEQGLQTQLRGFRPAHDFLETWVHDADPVRSILNMVEAAELSGAKDLDIWIGPETAGKVDGKRLAALTSQVGKVTVQALDAGLMLRVTYA